MALKLSVEPEVRTIFADKRSTKQVLINLLTNGIKFTPRGTTVRVRLPFAAVGENGERVAPKEAKIIPFRAA